MSEHTHELREYGGLTMRGVVCSGCNTFWGADAIQQVFDERDALRARVEALENALEGIVTKLDSRVLASGVMLEVEDIARAALAPEQGA